jgi:hypothetical protein
MRVCVRVLVGGFAPPACSGPEMELRSYRAVFDLERRIYRIDRLRLNPGGIPVRGAIYCLAILAALALAGTLPLLGAVVRALPWYLRDLALPAGSAAVLTMIRIEGRPFHLAAAALLRHALGPHNLAGLRADPRSADLRSAGGAYGQRWRPDGGATARGWRPDDLLILPDGSDARLRHLRYSGPGAVRVTAGKQVIALERHTELLVR